MTLRIQHVFSGQFPCLSLFHQLNPKQIR
uniref:Uncharacterized protein n=1 Tax=Rhizophora mucronata TaxID=61149 RepID=A0A2P2NQF2_RHIMU